MKKRLKMTGEVMRAYKISQIQKLMEEDIMASSLDKKYVKEQAKMLQECYL